MIAEAGRKMCEAHHSLSQNSPEAGGIEISRSMTRQLGIRQRRARSNLLRVHYDRSYLPIHFGARFSMNAVRPSL